MELQDQLEIASAALDLSMVAAHLVGVVDQVAGQAHTAWWGIAKANLQKAQSARTQEWLSGWQAFYASPAAQTTGRQDAAQLNVSLAQDKARRAVSGADQSRRLAENSLLRLGWLEDPPYPTSLRRAVWR